MSRWLAPSRAYLELPALLCPRFLILRDFALVALVRLLCGRCHMLFLQQPVRLMSIRLQEPRVPAWRALHVIQRVIGRPLPQLRARVSIDERQRGVRGHAARPAPDRHIFMSGVEGVVPPLEMGGGPSLRQLRVYLFIALGQFLLPRLLGLRLAIHLTRLVWGVLTDTLERCVLLAFSFMRERYWLTFCAADLLGERDRFIAISR